MFPIIPIWLMLIICALLIILIIKNRKKDIYLIVAIILVFTINLRIMVPTKKAQVLSNNLDVLFVVDNTISMNAEDYDGNNTRLSAVKRDLKYIAKRLNGARFSIITFNNTAKVVIPFTKDFNIANETIEIMQPISELFAKGTSLNTPLDTILYSLKSSENKDDRVRIIFFVSDGEITNDDQLISYKEVAKYVKNGAVLGYGTAKGGYMKVKDRATGTKEEYLMYSSGTSYGKALSVMDEENLRTIASDMKIDYIYMNKQSNINSKLKEIETIIKKGIETSDKSNYDDTYYFLILPLIILIALEFNKFWRRSI